MRVHDDRRAPDGARHRGLQRSLCRLLNGGVDGQDDVLARLGGHPDVFGLPVAQAVDEHGFHPGLAPQFRVELAFDADMPAIIWKPEVEVRDFAFKRAVVPHEIAEHVSREVGAGIKAGGLNLQINTGRVGGAFEQPGDLLLVEVHQHRQGQGELVGVVLHEVPERERNRLLKNGRDLLNDVTGDAIADLRLQGAALGNCLFWILLLDGIKSKPVLPEGQRVGDPLQLPSASVSVFGAELLAQFVEVKADVVAGPVLGNGHALPIQDLAANGRDANGAERLRLLVLRVVTVGNDLHPPEANDKNPDAQQDREGQRPQVGVVLLQLVENDHGAGGNDRWPMAN